MKIILKSDQYSKCKEGVMTAGISLKSVPKVNYSIIILSIIDNFKLDFNYNFILYLYLKTCFIVLYVYSRMKFKKTIILLTWRPWAHTKIQAE